MIDTLAFFIDSENIGWNGVKGFEKLGENDVIYYFSTVVHDKDTVSYYVSDFLDLLLTVKCRFEHIVIDPRTITNYMDDCIKTEIGRVFALNKDAECVIISRDQGYQACVEYWKNQGRCISQTTNIAQYLNCTNGDIGTYITTKKEIKIVKFVSDELLVNNKPKKEETNVIVNKPNTTNVATTNEKTPEKKATEPRPLSEAEALSMIKEIVKEKASTSNAGEERKEAFIKVYPSAILNKKNAKSLRQYIKANSFTKIFKTQKERIEFYNKVLPIMERVWN